MDDVYEISVQAKKYNSKLSRNTVLIFLPLSMVFLGVSIHFDYALWSVLLLIFSIIFFIICMMIYVSRKQRAVLLYDMNPRLYYAILHSGNLIKVGTDPDIEIFYFAGDYQKVIQFAQAEIDKAAEMGKKYANFNTLNILALSYFEISDYDNALKTIDYIKNTANDLKLANKKGYAQVTLPQLEYIESFVKYDFNKCLEFENMMTAKIKRANTFIARNKYYIALAKYYMGDIGGAKMLFEEIICFCPMLNYSNLANQYLKAINNDEIMTLNKVNTAFKYAGDIVLPTDEQTKKAKRKTLLHFIILIIVFIISVITLAIPDDEENMNDNTDRGINIVVDIQQE